MDNRIKMITSGKEWISLAASAYSFRFVKLCDDFSFVESSASNNDFDDLRGDGKKNSYFPVIKEDLTLEIYSIDVSKDEPQSEFVSTVQLLDTKTKKMTSKMTCYGSELSSKGMLWLAIFDRNVILGFDLVRNTVVHQFDHIPCPNDLAISATDEDIIYVAGGKGLQSKSNFYKRSKTNLLTDFLNEYSYVDMSGDRISAAIPTLGSVYKLNASTKSVEIVWANKNLHTLAGIIHVDNELHVAQLFDMRSANFDDSSPAVKPGCRSSCSCSCCSGKRSDAHDESIITWQGAEVGDGEETFLLDNLDMLEKKYIIGAIYRSMKTYQIAPMQNSFTTVATWGIGKLITCIYNAFTCSTANNSLNNAELLIQFHTKDKFDDLCFVVCDPTTRVNKHFQFRNITQEAKNRGEVS